MKNNPIAITCQPLAGRQLPKDWKTQASGATGTYDQRNLEDMWKTPDWSSKLNADNVENIVRSSRLA